MDLSKHIHANLILFKVKALNKQELLSAMTDCIMKSSTVQNTGLSREKVLQAIDEREKVSSTGVGSGFAFPHARLPKLKDLAICLAILDQEIDYDSYDNKPVTFACLILAPETKPTLALKAMSQIIRIFSHEDGRNFLQNVSSSAEIIKYIKSANIDLTATILARDIMRSPILVIHPEDSLKIITRRMAEKQIHVLPVVDKNKKIIGEIVCERLLQLGLPDFFSSLKSVRFIREFDPFEKYFHDEAAATAKDVMHTDFCTMPPDATILEVVFALSVNRFPKIYVIDNDKLVGIIDQSTVLKKIINL
ncbi:MAG: PTS sugar transporter subunit IIA [Pseudomonadota bacterium]